MKTRALLVISALLAFAQFAIATDEDIWNKANTAYDQGSYADAIEGYTSFLDRGHRFPEVYYNLGNAYFKDGKLGLAIASFRHCLKLDPAFSAARENLAYVRGFAVDKVETKPRGFLVDIWYGLAGILSPQTYFVLTIAFYWLFCAIVSLLIAGYGKRELVIYLLIITAFLFIFSAAITRFVVSGERNSHWGVVISPAVELREGPGDEFEKIFTGHEGLEFKIMAKRQGYILVELDSGLKGWIPQTSLTEI
jgi:hypothetical protein